MKKKTKLIITLSTLIVILITAISAIVIFSDQKSGQVAATVNGQKIYRSELEDKLNKMFKNQGQIETQKIDINNFPAQVLEALAQDIYLQRELNKIAANSPAAKNKELKKQIEDYKNSVLRQAYIDSLIADKINDKALKDRYSEISSELSGKKEVHLKHILIASEDEAKKIIALLKKKNSSFEKLAKQYSQDEASASAGGDLGYVIPDDLDEDFSKAIVGLKKDQISDPIKTKFGWHIVKVGDSRNVELPTFEALKTTIEDNLKQEIIEKAFGKITKNAKVKILINSKPLPQEGAAPASSAPALEAIKVDSQDEAKK